MHHILGRDKNCQYCTAFAQPKCLTWRVHYITASRCILLSPLSVEVTKRCATGCVVDVLDLQSGGCRFESRPGLLRTKVYSAFHPSGSGVGKWVPAAVGKAKADMAHSDCGWTCGCAGKTVKSLENTCHTWALLRWWFTTKRRYIKCMDLYLYAPLQSAFICLLVYKAEKNYSTDFRNIRWKGERATEKKTLSVIGITLHWG